MGQQGQHDDRSQKDPKGHKRQKDERGQKPLGWWQALSALVTPSPQAVDNQFSLYEATKARQQRRGGQGGRQAKQQDAGAEEDRDKSKFVQPKPVGEQTGSAQRRRSSGEGQKDEEDLTPYRVNDLNNIPDPIDTSLDINLKRLKAVFRIPDNKDLILRQFTISLKHPVKAAIFFIDGMADKNTIDWAVLQPLMLLADLPSQSQEQEGEQKEPHPDIFNWALNRLVPINQVSTAKKLSDAVKGVLTGATALLFDGSDQALVVETKGWEHRAVSRPTQEQVIRGPQEGFNETLRANTAMIRRRLKTPALMTEFFEVGSLSNTEVAMMYLDGLANQALLDEVRTRVKAISTDYISDSGILEQFVEDAPYSIYPSVLSTERPDRVAAFLAEGHVGLIINNNPYALVVPATMTGLLHTAEDAYVRWPFGTFLRLLRLTSYFVALTFPALYVAATEYHHETIPTDLAMAIAASRETVPFPVIVEVLLMAFAFELITEAAIRVPGLIGPTIGIVGALVLGQAAVQAGIISPILVIVIAMTALGAFTIPNYNLANSVRVMRYVYFLAASVLGFYGMAVLFFVDVTRLSAQRSFGVPMLNPIAPMKGGAGDVVIRSPVFAQEHRPSYAYPQDKKRQPERVRKWTGQEEDGDG